jgi:hypothetical protein
VNNICSILSTRRVPNGYGYLSGMGADKVSYPRVWVWVEFLPIGYTGMNMVLLYPVHTLSIAILR